MLSEDRFKAIKKIETLVCAELNKSGVPEILMRVLFEHIYEAMAEDKLSFQIPRDTAMTEVDRMKPDFIAPSTFKNAVLAIREALAVCRPPKPVQIPFADNGPGVACIDAIIDGTPHLVFVRGPQDPHRRSWLELRAEFRPLRGAAVVKTATPLADVTDPLNGRLAIVDEHTLPRLVEKSFDTIKANISSADRILSENERARDFIRRHLGDIVERLEHESRLWALGEIETDYDDFRLLTAWVEKLRTGDELLGLTDWQSDAGWWETMQGRRYRQANEFAIHRQAVIRRMFIHRSEETAHQTLQRVAEMDRQHGIGVEVRTVRAADTISAVMLADLSSSCVLRARNHHDSMESWLSYKVDRGDGRLLNRFSINPVEVRENERTLESLWQRATRYEPQGKVRVRQPRK